MALFRKNQPIAREGVLPYSNGLVLKKWDNLKQFIGKKVRLTDGHPAIDESNHTFEKGNEVGFAEIKQCPNRKKTLCIDLPENVPQRNGYSMGYKFTGKDESGVFNESSYSQIYNQVRLLTNIDHIALVNYPRDSSMLVAVDSDLAQYGLGTDSFEKLGNVIYMPSNEELEAELLKTKASEKIAKDEAEKWKKLAIDAKAKEVNSIVDSLVKQHGFKADDFKGKSVDFIKGSKFGADGRQSKKLSASIGEKPGSESDQDETDEDGLFDINDAILNEKGDLVIPGLK
jgi:hypothetical protein